MIDLKKLLNNRRGSVLALSLLVFLFLGGMLAAVSPMIINEVKMNTINRDMVDAQFVAEAGAKIGIAAIYAKKTSAELSWLGKAQALTTSENDKTYTVTISPDIDSTGPKVGTAYTVKSVGTIRGKPLKGISVVVTLSSNAGVYSYAVYTKGAMNLNGGPVINGDIASDGKITIQNNGIKVGNISYTGVAPSTNGAVTGTIAKVSSVGTLDVASLMKYTPTMPTMPTFTKPLVTSIPQSSSALTGAYDYTTNPNSGTYVYTGSFSDWSYSYTVAPNQSVLIYVDGDFTIGAPITGGGNITIYATGNIDVHRNVLGNNVKIYAGKSINLSESTNITGNDIVLQSGANFTVNNSGTVSAGTTGTVKIYSGGTLTLNAGGTIIGSNITLQSVGAVSISAENILADSASGIINIYSGRSFDYTGNSIIRGGTVTITTGKTSGTAVNLHGGYINSDRPTYITKIYSYGNAELTSTTLGGISAIVATGTLKNYGMASSAILIAQGDITSTSGSAAGLYTNGTLTTSGSSTIYANNASNAGILGLTSGAGGTDISVTNWNKAAI